MAPLFLDPLRGRGETGRKLRSLLFTDVSSASSSPASSCTSLTFNQTRHNVKTRDSYLSTMPRFKGEDCLSGVAGAETDKMRTRLKNSFSKTQIKRQKKTHRFIRGGEGGDSGSSSISGDGVRETRGLRKLS